jgi:colanic acid biosynthesis glycosyl transferase WcaI
MVRAESNQMAENLPPGSSNIFFVNRYFHPDQSATSQLLTDLASALAQSGFNVHVICSRQLYNDPHAHLSSSEAIRGVNVHRVPTTRFGRSRLVGRALDYMTFYGSCAFAMMRLLRQGDTVVAKTDPPLISIVAMAVARLKGAHLINWLQDIFPEVASLLGANPLPRALDAVLRRVRNLSLKSAIVNVVLGGRMRERLRHLGISTERIRVVENWAELDPDSPKAVDRSHLRARLGLTREFVVGYSGNLGRAHEYVTLLDAAVLLRSDPGIVFLMIGSGAGMTQLAQAVTERNLTNFRFLPYQPRESLSDALAAADVHWVSLRPALEGFIVPSKFYGILAASRPVLFIGDLDGELAREIRACECGAAVAVSNASEVARLLVAWKADPTLCEHMGRHGYEAYRQRFCAARAFEQWRSILTPASHVVGVSSPAPLHR